MTINAILEYAKPASHNCLKNSTNQNLSPSLPTSTLNAHVATPWSISIQSTLPPPANFAKKARSVPSIAKIVRKDTALAVN
jgi:hypothetical protein